MEDTTSVLNIADSIYVRIPAGMARWFGLKDLTEPRKCKIEEKGNKTAILIFE